MAMQRYDPLRRHRQQPERAPDHIEEALTQEQTTEMGTDLFNDLQRRRASTFSLNEARTVAVKEMATRLLSGELFHRDLLDLRSTFIDCSHCTGYISSFQLSLAEFSRYLARAEIVRVIHATKFKKDTPMALQWHGRRFSVKPDEIRRLFPHTPQDVLQMFSMKRYAFNASMSSQTESSVFWLCVRTLITNCTPVGFVLESRAAHRTRLSLLQSSILKR
ncbi:hypothetical protein NA57DRAFT_62169 [Rhizodiscina lignyota]|uniref:Uncharacterized protein n=1 Tax=Rhizodiscina lignyota TaxID=1504668 RepID=A0A9P4LZR3_9PEZI|nr:hypothetical protein NA57DRAFT_62169 [Rhizodiscina lignyota]